MPIYPTLTRRLTVYGDIANKDTEQQNRSVDYEKEVKNKWEKIIRDLRDRIETLPKIKMSTLKESL
jgi:hypothetical protein